MKVKTVINKHGEQQGSCIEIPLQGNGGALGMHTVEALAEIELERVKNSGHL